MHARMHGMMAIWGGRGRKASGGIGGIPCALRQRQVHAASFSVSVVFASHHQQNAASFLSDGGFCLDYAALPHMIDR